MQSFFWHRLLRRVEQFSGIFFSLWSLFNLENSDDLSKILSGFLIHLFFEKIIQQSYSYLGITLREMTGLHRSELMELDKILLFEIFSPILVLKDPVDPIWLTDEFLALAREVNENPSIVTRFVDRIIDHSKNFIDENTMSTNQYILNILKKNKCASNSHLNFEYLQPEELLTLIQLLHEYKAPQGLKITCNHHKIDNANIEEIQQLVMFNEIHHAALSCVTLQQGKRDETSDIAIFPQEILNKIYEYSFPFEENTKARKKFVNNVSINNIACLFNRKSARVDHGVGLFAEDEKDLSLTKRLIR